MFITIGIAIVGGCATGLLMTLVTSKGILQKKDYFNDKKFWTLPSDYDQNIVDKQPSKAEVELSTIA